MLRFVLIAALATTAAAADTRAKPARDPDKVRCKSQPVIGSFVQKTRECHTEAEWQKMRDAGRANAQQYQNAVNSGRTN